MARLGRRNFRHVDFHLASVQCGGREAIYRAVGKFTRGFICTQSVASEFFQYIRQCHMTGTVAILLYYMHTYTCVCVVRLDRQNDAEAGDRAVYVLLLITDMLAKLRLLCALCITDAHIWQETAY